MSKINSIDLAGIKPGETKVTESGVPVYRSECGFVYSWNDHGIPTFLDLKNFIFENKPVEDKPLVTLK